MFGPDERYRIDERLHRLNDLGFDVEELELVRGPDGYHLKLHPRVVEPGHHRRRLLETDRPARAGEPGAPAAQRPRALPRAPREGGGPAAADERGRGALARATSSSPRSPASRPSCWSKREAAEVFHELLEHRWFLSQQAGKDVGLMPAVDAYVEDVLRHVPDERRLLEDDAEED